MELDRAAFVKKVREYAQAEGWNRHEMDMLEEIEDLLECNVSDEQQRKEFGRLEQLLRAHQSQPLQENLQLEEYKQKEKFHQGIRELLAACDNRCVAASIRQAYAMEPEFALLKEGLQEACNAGANGDIMKNSQDFGRLFLSKAESFNSRFRTLLLPFTQELTGEYDRCFEQIKKRMMDTQIAAFKITEKQWYEKGDHSRDMLHAQIREEANAAKLEMAPFEAFATKCGRALEDTYKKHERITKVFYLIPLILYLVKYIVDTYIIQKEGIRDRLVNMLLERMVQNGENTTDGILKVMQTILPMLEKKGAVRIGADLIFAVICLGWLYFIYYVVVKKIRKSARIRSLGACAQQQLQEFMTEEPWQQPVLNTLNEMSKKIQNQYQRYFAFVNQMLVIEPLEENEGKTDRAAMLLDEFKQWKG